MDRNKNIAVRALRSFYRDAVTLLCKFTTLISPKTTARIRYWQAFRRKLNFQEPVGFNEQISVMKATTYSSDTRIRQCADKYAVREYVKECGCEEILPKLYAVYESTDEVNWFELPDSFAMKWNFGCGFNVICDSKRSLDTDKVLMQMKKWGKSRYHLAFAEMQYKDVPKRIIVEEYLKPSSGRLPDDYKFYCFHGNADSVMICHGRDEGHPKFYFFNDKWELQPLSKDSKNAPEGFTLPKPKAIDKAFEYAKRLCAPFPFVRVDLYVFDDRVVFGEMTFTPAGGIDSSMLPETDMLFGKLLREPN